MLRLAPGDGRCCRFRYRTQRGDDRYADHWALENAEAWTDGFPGSGWFARGGWLFNGEWSTAVAVRQTLGKGWQRLKSSTMNQDRCPPCGN